MDTISNWLGAQCYSLTWQDILQSNNYVIFFIIEIEDLINISSSTDHRQMNHAIWRHRTESLPVVSTVDRKYQSLIVFVLPFSVRLAINFNRSTDINASAMRNEPHCHPAASPWQRVSASPRSRCNIARIVFLEFACCQPIAWKPTCVSRARSTAITVQQGQSDDDDDLVTSATYVGKARSHDFRSDRHLQFIDCSGRWRTTTDRCPLRHRRSFVYCRRHPSTCQRLSSLPVSAPATSAPSRVRSHTGGAVRQPASASVWKRQRDIDRGRECSATKYRHVGAHEADQDVHVTFEVVAEQCTHDIIMIRTPRSPCDNMHVCLGHVEPPGSLASRTVIVLAPRSADGCDKRLPSFYATTGLQSQWSCDLLSAALSVPHLNETGGGAKAIYRLHGIDECDDDGRQ